jgi:hypothetical protein
MQRLLHQQNKMKNNNNPGLQTSNSSGSMSSAKNVKTLQRSASDMISGQDTEVMRQTLKAKTRVGSIHGRTVFGPDDNAFHPNDVPQRARACKMSVRRSLTPDILGTQKTAWQQSVDLGERPCVRKMRHMSAVSLFCPFDALFIVCGPYYSMTDRCTDTIIELRS